MRNFSALVFVLVAAAPVHAGTCTSSGWQDQCGRALQLVAEVAPDLPREIAPGIRLQSLHEAGPDVIFDLLVAADLRLPDAAGFAALACADARIAGFVDAGGRARYLLNDREIAVVTTCKKAP